MVVRVANLDNARLRILSHARCCRLPNKITETDRELKIYADLVESGLLDGWITVGRTGEPLKVVSLKITPDGEDFLEDHGEPEVLAPVLTKDNCSLVGCVAGYLLVLSLFVVIQCGAQFKGVTKHGDDSNFAHSQELTGLDDFQKHFQKSHFADCTFGVCGIPPSE